MREGEANAREEGRKEPKMEQREFHFKFTFYDIFLQ